MCTRIWLTWEIQRRNRSLSEKMGAALHELVCDAPWWKRYPLLIIKTIILIRKIRPDIVFVQNPSLLLAGLVVGMGKLINMVVVVDAHNAGLFPIEGKYNFLNKLAAFINGHAKLVIVTNEQLKKYVEKNGGIAVSIPDPIPKIPCVHYAHLPTNLFNILFVCSWAEDEPYKEVILAAQELKENVRIYITGDSKGMHKNAISEIPLNIELTGFVSEQEFEALLCASDAVMVLTKRENCLVCGAYEGVAVKKPLILSDTNALRTFFDRGCVYTKPTVGAIVSAIESVVQDHSELRVEIEKFNEIAEREVSHKISNFKKTLR